MEKIKLSNNMSTRNWRDMYRSRIEHAQYERVSTVYERPSARKLSAEKSILDLMFERGGYGYTVLSHNTFSFTCAYVFPHPETGELILCIETPSNTWYTLY